ncbi:MAG TPA: ABC transporter ATP-binding protein [Candidatus Binataceae bacterium]|nr:ABC transporter ATP-binding protein [Candidatus Binataceae bacterium]
MGVGKFTLPLLFPLAFKYVIDVLLASPPKFDAINLRIDHGCIAVAHLLRLGASPEAKLEALSLVMIALYLLQSLTSYFRDCWAGIAGNRLIFDLQCKLYEHVQRLPHSFFDRNPTGSIVSRVLNDVLQANELVSSAIIDVWTDAASLALVIAMMFALDWRLALVALAIMPLWVMFMRYFSPRIKAVSHLMQQALEEVASDVHERIAGATTVKSFGREEHEVLRFRHRTDHLYERTIDKVRLAARQQMLVQLLTRCAPTIVVWVAALMIMRGTLTLGTLIAFFTLIGFVYLPLERFAQLSVVVSAALASIERIFGFLDLTPDIIDHPLSRPFAVRNGTVQFDNVSFCYPARAGGNPDPVLREINLHIAGGSKVALVGRSGAGKTTLANLIPRFYDATAGRILLDGRDVRHYTLKSLRENVSLVAQDALLFSASVRDNLLYARPEANDAQLWQSLELANLDGFVRELPDQLDTVIGERGVKVSGGQRQRLALARAFLKGSRIVILDEATSAVDSESENLIHEAMERLMNGRTVFLITHRLRSAVTADQIAVIDDGRIVETGTHAELLRRRGHYARLFLEQARGLSLDPSVLNRIAG